MGSKKRVLTALALPSLVASGAALALPAVLGNGDPVPVQVRTAIQKAKTTMPQAVQKAEKETDGEAIEAFILSANDRPFYLVSVKDPLSSGVIDVKVDARNGQVFGEPEKMHIENAGPPVGD